MIQFKTRLKEMVDAGKGGNDREELEDMVSMVENATNIQIPKLTKLNVTAAAVHFKALKKLKIRILEVQKVRFV